MKEILIFMMQLQQLLWLVHFKPVNLILFIGFKVNEQVSIEHRSFVMHQQVTSTYFQLLSFRCLLKLIVLLKKVDSLKIPVHYEYSFRLQ